MSLKHHANSPPATTTTSRTIKDAAKKSDRNLSPQAEALVDAFATRLQTVDSEALQSLDVSSAASRLVASLPIIQKSPWDKLVGPFYDTTALMTWKSVSRQRLWTLKQQNRLLGLKTAENDVLYPVFQFGSDGSLLPHLDQVMRILSTGIDDDWTRALWLNTPVETWSDQTAADMLRGSAEQVSEVLLMAEQDAASRVA